MNLVLKAKSAYDNALVTRVWENIGDHVTEEEAWEAVDKAATEVREVVGPSADHCVYGWSGGKDSLALQVVMEKAGVHRAVLGIVGDLEWRGFLDWYPDHQPEGLVVYSNTVVNRAWLADPYNDRYLFPANAKDGYFWTLAGTRSAQNRYQDAYKPTLHIYGRRRQDGNKIGNGAYGIAASKKTTVYCPIRDWPHELVLAVIHYAGKQLPPIYSGPAGWKGGTGPWPGRRTAKTRPEAWQQVWDWEPDRVREAHEAGVPSAATFLRHLGHA